MANKTEPKTKVTKSTAKPDSKAKDLGAKKSPKGGGGDYWGKLPNHNISGLEV